jgi:choline dehydrogenase-like flavoprotein
MASKKFNLKDEVVVIIGSGAGGGTLGNELAQKGIDVVILEAGKRHEINDFENDEWPMFSKISWLDKRTTSGTWRVAKDFPNLPAWIVKAVGGSTVHWAGASLRFQEHEFKTKTVYGNVAGANLLDWPTQRSGAVLRSRRRQDGHHRYQRHSSSAGQQQLQSPCGRRQESRLQEIPHWEYVDQLAAA